MGVRIDLRGQKFGRLTAQETFRRNGAWLWSCMCECGNEVVTDIGHLRSGNTKSCGCLNSDLIAERNRTHGLTGTPGYRSWKDMRQRCNNPRDSDYSNYGGRGIKVCSRWDDFSNFLEDMGPPEPGLTLDRIDVNGGYGPENCRWATRAEQLRNQRRTNLIEAFGKVQCIGDWAREYGLATGTIRYRMRKGMTAEQALVRPAKPGYLLEVK